VLETCAGCGAFFSAIRRADAPVHRGFGSVLALFNATVVKQGPEAIELLTESRVRETPVAIPASTGASLDALFGDARACSVTVTNHRRRFSPSPHGWRFIAPLWKSGISAMSSPTDERLNLRVSVPPWRRDSYWVSPASALRPCR
jgi:hypothetical protein